MQALRCPGQGNVVFRQMLSTRAELAMLIIGVMLAFLCDFLLDLRILDGLGLEQQRLGGRGQWLESP